MHSELEIHESKQRRPVFQPIEAPCTVLAAPPLKLKLIAVSGGHQYVSPHITMFRLVVLTAKYKMIGVGLSPAHV
jgi:hypothetical protein